MATVRKAEFADGPVDVDDNVYENCRFYRCEIRFNGGGPPSFIGCEFVACSLGLGGAAGRTINYLSSIYHGFGEWGRTSLELTFEQIRSQRPPGVNNPDEENTQASAVIQ